MKKIIILYIIAFLLTLACVMYLMRIIDETYPSQTTIHNNGVGNILLKKPIPAIALKNQDDPYSIYFYGFFADGIAYEGFDLVTPPIRVAINNGPFSKWDKSTTDPFDNWPPKEDITSEALNMSPKNMIVRFIVIESDKVRTRKGIGVGSNLGEIKKKYKLIGVHRVPPSFGGDECSVKVEGLENILFYFKNKQSAENGGKVVRVSIRKRT